jgi:hypothetical protein
VRIDETSEGEEDLDAVDPRSTFIGTNAPPFLPNLRGSAVSADGCEQESRDQCGAKEVEEGHPDTSGGKREQGRVATFTTSRLLL